MKAFLATWFGTGWLLGRLRGMPGGSGTLASALTVPLALVLGSVGGWPAQLAAAVIVAGVGLWVITEIVSEVGDAGWVVIDEAAGTFVALLGITSIPAALVAFAVFRLADVLKDRFPGVGAADRSHGATGVMGDDLIAGLYGLAAGHVVQALI